MLVFLLWVGDFELDPTSDLFYNFIAVVSTVVLYRTWYAWWMVWSGLLVLVVKRVGKFSFT